MDAWLPLLWLRLNILSYRPPGVSSYRYLKFLKLSSSIGILRALINRLIANGLVCESVLLLENITQPPFMLFMKLHVTREEIDGAGIIFFVRGPRGGSHLLNNYQEISIC